MNVYRHEHVTSRLDAVTKSAMNTCVAMNMAVEQAGAVMHEHCGHEQADKLVTKLMSILLLM